MVSKKERATLHRGWYIHDMFRDVKWLILTAMSVASCGKFQSLEKQAEKVSLRQGSGQATIGTFEFVAIPAGRYRVGSVEGGAGEQPREVETSGFWISTTEVTEKQFGGEGSQCPVANITIEEAGAFCKRLSEASGKSVRLPTEDEWEIAARGGVRGARYPWGWGDPVGRAVFAAKRSRRVGTYSGNGYGLRDMAGNVAEWCGKEANAVVRGGNWADRDLRQLEVFRRVAPEPGYRGLDVGFRIVLEKP